MFEVGDNVVVIALALIAILPGIAAAYYAKRAADRAAKVDTATTVISQKIDGRMDEILRLSQAASRAEGVAAGSKGEAPGTRELNSPNVTPSLPKDPLRPPGDED